GKREKNQWIIFLKQTRSAAFWSLVWFGLIMMWLKSFWSVILMLLALQIGLVLLMLVRREIDEASTEGESQNLKPTTPKSSLWQKMKYIILHDENRNY
ncbi:MAG TPA: hypothetical protein PLR98_03800, partial [Chitinophagaceae bacterium]|nr:hypothetical protein [Chitinophagaceae bacterium]